MANQKIFFSYSRVDGSQSALRLATDLKKKGYDVWIDQEDIRAGMEWDAEIEKGLETCDCLLFLATEKSVASTNVLDEVYFALEQRKKVIPLIFVNSKIPFRLNRLQHIDFTKDYDAALGQLANELEGTTPDIHYTAEAKSPATQDKPSLAKYYKALMMAGGFIVMVGGAVQMFWKGKGPESTETKGAIVLADTAAGNISRQGSMPDNVEPTKGAGAGPTIVNTSTVDRGQVTGKAFTLEDVSGDWALVDVAPKAQPHRGYLQIDESDGNKASIKAYMQFYYPNSKAAASLVVFNAFAGCPSCAINKEMKLKVEDISVSTHTIKTAKEDQPNGKKAGDTISDAGATRSIYGSAVLQFADKNNAVIKVMQKQVIELTSELKLEPFVYTFSFKKKE